MRRRAWEQVATLAQRTLNVTRDNDLAALESLVIEFEQKPRRVGSCFIWRHEGRRSTDTVQTFLPRRVLPQLQMLSVLPRTDQQTIAHRAAVFEAEGSAAAKQTSKRSPKRDGARREVLPPLVERRITRIEIRKFRAIEELELEIPNSPPGEDGIPGGSDVVGRECCWQEHGAGGGGAYPAGNEANRSYADHGARAAAAGADAEQAEIIRRTFVYGLVILRSVSPSIARAGFPVMRSVSSCCFGYGPRRFFAPGSSKRHAPGTLHARQVDVRSTGDPQRSGAMVTDVSRT